MQEVGNIIKSLIGILIFSRMKAPIKRPSDIDYKECVVLGNGPSLKETLRFEKFFDKKTKICVNDFADSDYFFKLKPSFYLLMDPAFWQNDVSLNFKKNSKRYQEIFERSIDWDLTLILPVGAKKKNTYSDLPKYNKNIKICYLNTTEIYSNQKFNFFLYRKNLAMPKMQNVLVAAIFLALNLKYKKIYLLGADHSWHESIYVGDDNILYLKNKRFNDDGAKKLSPFYGDIKETKPYKMGNLLRDLSRMFSAYMELEEYAKSLKAKIYNASAKTYIDAFERYKIKK